jgi:hypothetical protein
MELAPLYVGDESLMRFSIGDGESGLKIIKIKLLTRA